VTGGRAKGDGPDGPGTRLADFAANADGAVVSCPEGRPAVTVPNGKGDGFVSGFDAAGCAACPRREGCLVSAGRGKAALRYTAKQMRLSRRRAGQETKPIKDLYRLRSGIEATNSVLVRFFGLKRLRVRGQESVSTAVEMMAMGVNLRRYAAWRRRNAINAMKTIGGGRHLSARQLPRPSRGRFLRPGSPAG
jgi:hypothetical protein